MFEQVEVNSERWFNLINLKNEVWKNINNFPNYQVSNYGRIKSFKNQKCIILKCVKKKTGYLEVVLSKRQIKKYSRIHRLVANAFIPNLNNYLEINHKNANKQDNKVNNLEWVTHVRNIQHSVENKLRGKYIGKDIYNARKVYQYDLNYNFIKEWDSVADIKRALGYSTGSIICCCLKKPRYKTSHKYIWSYEKLK